MNAIIIDDEQPAIDLIRGLLEEDGRITVSATFRKPLEALALIDTVNPDIVFLDVRMPLMSGMELAERLLRTGREIDIVFITAHREYALEAFGLAAADYICKPVTKERLGRTINKLLC